VEMFGLIRGLDQRDFPLAAAGKLYRAGRERAEFYRRVSAMCQSHGALVWRACLAHSPFHFPDHVAEPINQ